MTALEVHSYRVLFTDAAVTEFVGNPLDSAEHVEIILRFNEVSTGVVECEAFPWLVGLLATPGTRAVVIRDRLIELAGPIETYEFEYDAGVDGEDGNGRVVIYVADDLALIAGRVTYPDPANAATGQTAARYTFTTVNGEDALRDLVDVNAGPSALAARQVAALALGADNGIGVAVSYSTRFEPLLDAARAIAIAAGNLGFRTVQDGLSVLFEVYDPRDLTDSARFSRGRGNLRRIRYQPSAPICTAAIVGGEDAGTARVIRERLNTALITDGWGRVESFVDRRDVTDVDELDAAGDDALSAGTMSIRLEIDALDTPAQHYRVNYGLGDVVSVEVYPGVTVPEIIRAIKIDFSATKGEVITPIIGTADAVTTGPTASLQRSILRQQQLDAAAGELP